MNCLKVYAYTVYCVTRMRRKSSITNSLSIFCINKAGPSGWIIAYTPRFFRVVWVCIGKCMQYGIMPTPIEEPKVQCFILFQTSDSSDLKKLDTSISVPQPKKITPAILYDAWALRHWKSIMTAMHLNNKEICISRDWPIQKWFLLY